MLGKSFIFWICIIYSIKASENAHGVTVVEKETSTPENRSPVEMEVNLKISNGFWELGSSFRKMMLMGCSYWCRLLLFYKIRGSKGLTGNIDFFITFTTFCCISVSTRNILSIILVLLHFECRYTYGVGITWWTWPRRRQQKGVFLHYSYSGYLIPQASGRLI